MIGKMKKLLLIVALAGAVLTANAQTGEWTWLGGDEQVSRPIQFGVQGTASPSNDPGTRGSPISWTDASGNFWLFGGYASVKDLSAPGGLVSGDFSDMWEFNPSTKVWTWVAGPNRPASSGVYGTLGTPAAGNYPGPRSAPSKWKDSSGNLWLFGGEGADSTGNYGYLNDLWKFNPSTLEWTWMGGANQLPTCPSTNSCGPPGVYGTLGTSSPANIPGGRSDAQSWTDSNGNFWLFGGRIYIVYLNGWGGYENDLWMYSPQTNEWTWMGGSSSLPSTCTLSNSCGQPGVYGQQQTASAANIPGAREDSITWTDQAGNLWLFGGFGFDAQDVRGDMNDLWEFSPSTKEWKWVTGSDSVGSTYSGPAGTYGLWQISAAGNSLGGREQGVGWTGSTGNLWLFGGYGFGSSNVNGAFSAGILNDLWEFNPATSQWTWISGSSSVNQNGSYGTMGQSSVAATPGGEVDPASWTDKSGDLWLYGGDFWVFKPNAAGPPVVAAPSIAPAGGTYAAVQSVTITDSTPGATIYYRIGSAGVAVLYSGPISVYTSETIEAVASASGYADSPAASASYVLNLPAPPAPSFNPPPGTYSAPPVVTISDSDPADPYAVIYYTTNGTTPSTQSPVYTGPFTVLQTETVNAIAVAGGNSLSPLASATYTIPPTPQNTWVYLRGTSQVAQAGAYGIPGLTLAQNYPGSRDGAASWTDAQGNYWVFGGAGTDANGNPGWLNDLWEYNTAGPIQDNLWTWIGGADTVPCQTIGGVQQCSGNAGRYGTMGTGSTSNIPGGRRGAATWTDSSGRFWLFGGYGMDAGGHLGYLNDLWMFNPQSLQWTWISGSNSNQLLVKAETYGQAGVYGTLGTGAPGNVPGTRAYAAYWIDGSGNLWLFGGMGIDVIGQLAHLNDLWMFNPVSSQWTWIGGSELSPTCVDVPGDCGAAGVYGALGRPSSSNIPGGRQFAASWTDTSGNFWLFGGDGFDSNDAKQGLNDLWMYSSSKNQWTWIAGASTFSCPLDPIIGFNVCDTPSSVFGTLGVAAAGNTPGGRLAPATWADKQGNLWLMGTDWMNDLWLFQPSIGQWTWMGGDYAPSNCLFELFIGGGAFPVFACAGNQGSFSAEYVFDVGNIPGARSSASSFVDRGGNFWLFSGYMYNLNPAVGGPVNDLWSFQPSAGALPPAAEPVLQLRTGVYTAGGQLNISNGMPTASIYYTTDGTTPSTSSTPYTGPIQVSSTMHVRAFASAPGYANSGVAAGDYVFPGTPAAPTFSVASGSYSSVQTVTLSDSSFYTAFLFTTDGSDPNTDGTLYTGPISVNSSESIRAIAVVSGYAVWNSTITGLTQYNGYTTLGPTFDSPLASVTYTLSLPAAAVPAFNPPGGSYTSAQTVTMSDSTTGSVIYYTTDGTMPTTSSTRYTAPITISATETIQAIATESGYAQSAVATAAYTINLPPPSFAITGTAVTVTRGATSGNTSTITVTPSGGFTGTVNLTCAIAPTAASDPATCSIPQSVTISGASAQTVTLAVTTTAATAALNRTRKLFWPSVGGAALACILLVGIPRRRRRWQSMLGLLVLLISITCAIAACGGGNAGGGGGGGGNPGTTPGAYTITVTGTSGALSASGTVSLTVQ